MEASPLILSIHPLAGDSRHVARANPPSPLPPPEERPGSPEEEPTNHARQAAARRLPALFHLVDHQRHRSALANSAHRAPARRRHWRRSYRVFPDEPGRFAYTPARARL